MNLISAVSHRGSMRFMLYRENMTADVLIRLMQQLMKGAGRKVFMLLDNLRVHQSKVVQAWPERHREHIECSSCRVIRQSLIRTNLRMAA